MKKLISCLLAVMMLCTAVSAFAEALVEKSNALTKFLDETDLQTKDLALQVQSGDESSDLVIRYDGENLHMVARSGDKVDAHVQYNATGIYMAGEGDVKLLRYATIITIMQDMVKEMNSLLDEAIKDIPEESAPTEAEMKGVVNELTNVISEAAAKEQADAITLSTATAAFASKFRPEEILDVKEEGGALAISLRSDAYAAALGEAMDEMMSNAELGKLVDEQAKLTGDKTFAEAQQAWQEIREATLEAVRTIKSDELIDENGHYRSCFQIGKESAETKVLDFDTDSWVNEETGEVDVTLTLGFKDEDPFMGYKYAINQYSYNEKLTAGDSFTEIKLELNEDHRPSYGTVKTVLDGQEKLWAEFGPDYMYMKGPKAGISTSVRETWTGKTRYEVVAENAKGEEFTVTVDFYEENDSLVSELHTNQSDRTVVYRISRIDKVDIEDLSASEKITEITADEIYNELGELLKLAAPALTTDDAKTAE